MHKRTNADVLRITIIAMGLILCVFLIMSINSKAPEFAKPNYYGMALMGLIPSNEVCQMQSSPQLYEPIGLGTTINGKDYDVVKNKLGGETCLVKA